jgi:hypothetical protein
VVILVRDPRGVYASRSSGPILNWCKNEQCANPEIGCSNLMDDLKATELFLNLNERLKLISNAKLIKIIKSANFIFRFLPKPVLYVDRLC